MHASSRAGGPECQQSAEHWHVATPLQLTMAIFGIDNSGDESWQYWKTIWVVRPIMVALLSICMLGVDEAASQVWGPVRQAAAALACA